jgi:hypothetical protein
MRGTHVLSLEEIKAAAVPPPSVRDFFRLNREIAKKNAESEEARERRIAQLVEAALPHDAAPPDTHVLSLEEIKAIHDPLTAAIAETIVAAVPPPSVRDFDGGKVMDEALAEEDRHRAFDEEDRRNARVVSLKGLLVDAAGWNVDRDADVLTIRRLLDDEGCDLEADILPTVARTVPELPRPLKSWGAQWLIRDILTARDRRLFPTLALRRPLADEDSAGQEDSPGEDSPVSSPEEAVLDILVGVAHQPFRPASELKPLPGAGRLMQHESVVAREEAPPPARRLSAMDWDEFVAGHRAGLIEWNTALLSPGRGGQGSARRRRESRSAAEPHRRGAREYPRRFSRAVSAARGTRGCIPSDFCTCAAGQRCAW